jgi:mannose-6-phosphate isomerase-like protein (cupin superfamily)
MKVDDFFVNAVRQIEYEDKYTDDEERFGINRLVTKTGGVEFVKLYSDTKYKPHIHDRASAKFIFLVGEGEVLLDDEVHPFIPGTIIDVLAGVMHGFNLREETIFLSVQSNPIQDRETGEIDIRYE